MTQQALYNGKVLRATRNTYLVLVGENLIPCTLRGKLVADRDSYVPVKTGDDVQISINPDGEGAIESLLPRRSQLSRSIESRAHQEHIIAVNIDLILIILSVKRPYFKPGLLDRYLVIAEKNRLQACICLNKIDLDSADNYQRFRDYYPAIGYPVLFTSAKTGEGLQALREQLGTRVSAIVGQSGVGKSSLINALEPQLDLRLGDISERTLKGQHTTTAAELFPLSGGGFILDTPGVRELGLWEIYKRDLQNYFCEFVQLSPECQFADCQHTHEPGCAIKEAVEREHILAERYQNYLNIYDSLKNAHYE